MSVQQTNFPLTLLAFPRQRLVLEALFDATIHDPRLVRQLLGHLEAVLEGFTTAAVLDQVELMRPPEHAEVAHRGSPRASFPLDGNGPLPARFAAWVRHEPDRIAVSSGGQRISYGELGERVARLAHRLRGLGVGPGVLVGIHLARGIDLVVAVLAVACAGGGYVPVDRRHPPVRVRSVLRDASVRILLTDHAAAGELELPTMVRLDDPDEAARLAALPGVLPTVEIQAVDVAYVIYTSGSTGSPKGVIVEHGQLARLFDATRGWFEFSSNDVWTLFHSIAFDFSVWELWGALAHGARLVVVPDELTRDPAAFRQLLLDEGVTVLNQTPSGFRVLSHADAQASATPSPFQLRLVILGGEKLEVSSMRWWLDRYGDRRPSLVNMYGITETTVHVTYRPIGRADLSAGVPSPIGEPIPDLAVQLVDRRGRLVPVGVPGEIYVGGDGVARGYLGRPDLTAERFVDAPDGQRWYRSGDQARWLPEGGLEFLGRVDDQVKIRGHRIELGEISAVLNDHPAVRESVVVATPPDVDGHRQLIAYLVAEDGPDWAQLRGWLADRLPDYLVPAGFVGLDRLPLTPNGKIDRAALPAPHAARPDREDPVAPRTDVEQVLAQVWAEVLGRDEIGVADNFFALGGDSILTIQVVSRAARRGVAITPAQLFAHQTIAGLAQVAAAAGPAVEAHQGEVSGDVTATPAAAWFHRLALPHAGWWNLPVLLLARRPVRREWLADALTALVTHHDLLRLRVSVDDRGRPRQRIISVAEHGPVAVDEFDPMGPAAVEGAVRRTQQSLDLVAGPLLRAAVFRAPAGEPERVLLVAHHLVVDAVSWPILLEDLATSYRRIGSGEPIGLPAKTTDFAQWARTLAELARSDQTARQARWWLDRLPPRAPALPVERGPSAPNREGDSDVVMSTLDETVTAHLLAPAHRAYRTRPEELALAALAQAMARWTREPRLLVDVESHGRDVAVDGVDVSRTVGWFTRFIPTWLDLTGVDIENPAPVIKAVKEQLQAMPSRGSAFGLVRWLRDDDLARDLARLPEAQISFNYLGRLDSAAPADADFELAPEPPAEARHPANPRPYLVDVVAGVRMGRLQVYLTYPTKHYSRSTMERLATGYIDALRALVDHCLSPGAGGPTPSDFPLARVDQEQLDRLIAERGPVEDLYPLAPLQRGLLYHTLANPNSGVYFEQFSIRLDGPLDLDAFERAWVALLERHAVLRAGIVWQGRLSDPHLIVQQRVALPLTQHDWRDRPEERQAAELEELLARDRSDGFDLAQAPLTRLHLIRLGERRWRLVWSHHHVLLDGWSVALLIQEIFDTYEAMRAGQYVPADPPPPYRDYIAYLEGLDFAAAWAHWRRVLSGVTEPTPLGADRPAMRTGRRDTDYARVQMRLPLDRSDAVREFARRERLTLDTVLHGAWALVLAHRSGHDDVVFGVTSSGRPPTLPGVEEMVGLFINTLPSRVRVSRDQSVMSWLSGLLRDQVKMREFEHTPLDQVRSWTSVPPDRPLFDSGRGLENYPMDGSRFRTGGVSITEIETFEQSNFALSFVVVPDDALFLQLWYDALRFTPPTAEQILRTVEVVVLGLVADPERTVGEVLDLVTADRPAASPVAAPSEAGRPAELVERAGRVAARLQELTAVREAVVTPAPDGDRLTAYVVADVAAVEREDGLAGQLERRHVEQWRSLYDKTYAGAGPADVNFIGWNSSYTGGPIAVDAMVEWRTHTLDRIRALNPVRILEIGCGNGLLLFGLLDDCERYVGTDFSAVCLAQVSEHLATYDAATRAKVTLLERAADDFTDLKPGSFDVVILNSVVQYFPGLPYTERVLDAALAVAAPGGAVFVGDLRHHGLLDAFHVSVQLHRAVDMLPVDELGARVSRAVEHERELLVDPAYFAVLAAAHPEIAAVQVLPKRGRHDTELTRYRYDAVLRLSPLAQPPAAEPAEPPAGDAGLVSYDWSRDVLSRGEIGWLLDTAEVDTVEVTGVPNARVAVDVEAARLVARSDGLGTAGELRLAAGRAAAGLDPEDLYLLGEGKDWSVTVGWAMDHADGSVDAVFWRGPDRAPGRARAMVDDRAAAAGGPLANAPLRTLVVAEVERRAAELLRQCLPESAGGGSVLVVDALPRTADGRVDEAALPAAAVPSDSDAGSVSGRVPPRTADELRLARVWEQALRVSPVDVRTSFFELGGDSLLAIRVIDEAARVFGRDIPLTALLREPTIEAMASALQSGPGSWMPLVELAPGDGPAFFCVHPAGGSVLCYADLARQMDPYAFCALQARGVDGDDPPYDDLSAMAARYLVDVRDRQPAGPYLLGGWSLGGLVAYEMAQQLAAAGEPVGLLALVETPTPDLIEDVPDDATALARSLEGLVSVDLARLRAMPAPQRLRYVLAEAERAGVVPPGLDPGRAQRLFEVYSAHLDAARRYVTRPYDGRTLLVRAADSTIAVDQWRTLLSGEWEVAEVPGTHESVVWPPNVDRLADTLRAAAAAALTPA